MFDWALKTSQDYFWIEPQFLQTEAATEGVLQKKVFLKIFQNLQK